MVTRSPPLDPVTIAFAKAHCTGVQVHCMRCQNFVVIGFDAFHDEWLVMDLPRHKRFRCSRCGGSWVETRPDYPSIDHRRSWHGLEKADKNTP